MTIDPRCPPLLAAALRRKARRATRGSGDQLVRVDAHALLDILEAAEEVPSLRAALHDARAARDEARGAVGARCPAHRDTRGDSYQCTRAVHGDDFHTFDDGRGAARGDK